MTVRIVFQNPDGTQARAATAAPAATAESLAASVVPFGQPWEIVTSDPPGPDHQWLEGQWVALPTPAPVSADVTVERDRRIRAGFRFQGKLYDFDADSQARVAGAASTAGFAVGGGAQPSNLRWADPNNDFAWIANDNSLNPMDAQTCFAFGQVAMAHVSAHIFAARALRTTAPIPGNFTADGYWPVV